MSFIIQNVIRQIGDFVKKNCKRCGKLLHKKDEQKGVCETCTPKDGKKGR